MNKIEIGKQGETLAANHLIEKGYRVIERNYRYGHGEIDLIVRKEDTIIFVEVKTDTQGRFGDPIYWVTPRKQKQIGKIAQIYILQHRLKDVDYRFDVVAINWTHDPPQIEHLENAFWL
ncbi:YraN family protein [candidate division KSB1 bacterium]|nr:YraN family protein [candidate division KSB1 bacterium]